MLKVGDRVSLNSLVCNCDGAVTEVISTDKVKVLWDSSLESGPKVVLTKNVRLVVGPIDA